MKSVEGDLVRSMDEVLFIHLVIAGLRPEYAAEVDRRHQVPKTRSELMETVNKTRLPRFRRPGASRSGSESSAETCRASGSHAFLPRG